MKLSKYTFNVGIVLLLVPGIAHADNPYLIDLIGAIEGTERVATTSAGETSEMSSGSPSNYGISGALAFAVDYGNAGVLRGHGRCSTRPGASDTWGTDNGFYQTIQSNFVENLTDETGQSGAQYCYCQLDSYTPYGGNAQTLDGPWVFVADEENGYECWGDECCPAYCGDYCADSLFYGDSWYMPKRSAIFDAYARFSGQGITTRTYVDNKLSGKQSPIAPLGANKLMTYGSTPGSLGEREIVSSLGTSMTATSIPEAGTVATGIQSKQGLINGPADVVMMGTGTAGVLGERPIYSTTNNFDTALITAQTINTTVTNAANNKITCVDNDCLLMQINTSVPAGISTRLYLDPSISGTSSCYRRFDGTNPINGECSTDTLAYIGDSTSKSGKFGVVFPYGEVTGISVCSSINGGTAGTVASSSRATTLDRNFNTQTAGGSIAGRYLWCKITSPAISSWVYLTAIGTTTRCKELSASNCAQAVIHNAKNMSGPTVWAEYANFKRSLFGSFQ